MTAEMVIGGLTVPNAYNVAWETVAASVKYEVQLSRFILVACRKARAYTYKRGLLGTDVRLEEPKTIAIPVEYVQVKQY